MVLLAAESLWFRASCIWEFFTLLALLVLWGLTYTNRLWCIWELFTWAAYCFNSRDSWSLLGADREETRRRWRLRRRYGSWGVRSFLCVYQGPVRSWKISLLVYPYTHTHSCTASGLLVWGWVFIDLLLWHRQMINEFIRSISNCAQLASSLSLGFRAARSTCIQR